MQDMPPPGGFGAVPFAKTNPKFNIAMKGVILGPLVLVWSYYGMVKASKIMKDIRARKIEKQEHYIAIEPFLVAERERRFLRHLRENREYERELMKDHEGWVVGTLYGEKVFKTLPEDAIPPVDTQEWSFPHGSEWFLTWLHPSFWL